MMLGTTNEEDAFVDLQRNSVLKEVFELGLLLSKNHLYMGCSIDDVKLIRT